MEKEKYKFRFNNEILEFSDFNAMLKNGLVTEQEYNKRYNLMLSALNASKERERKWRNEELSKTDYMLADDATYKKIRIKTSAFKDDILTYREALRDYDLMLQERPIRPEWFK